MREDFNIYEYMNVQKEKIIVMPYDREIQMGMISEFSPFKLVGLSKRSPFFKRIKSKCFQRQNTKGTEAVQFQSGCSSSESEGNTPTPRGFRTPLPSFTTDEEEEDSINVSLSIEEQEYHNSFSSMMREYQSKTKDKLAKIFSLNTLQKIGAIDETNNDPESKQKQMQDEHKQKLLHKYKSYYSCNKKITIQELEESLECQSIKELRVQKELNQNEEGSSNLNNENTEEEGKENTEQQSIQQKQSQKENE